MFDTIAPDGPLYRIARVPDAWAWPDWANAGPDGTFGNRWDDPEGVYRVVYASSSPLGAYVEVLSRFRPDLQIVKALAEIEGDGELAEAPGELDTSWLRDRVMGVAPIAGEFVDISQSRSLARIRETMAARALHHRLNDLDAAAIRLTVPRGFTQEISRHVYEESTPTGRPRYAGISYRSKLGDEFRNRAIFEPANSRIPFADGSVSNPLSADDPDFLEALKLFGIRLTAS